jgi:RND family efflux transporter MFP subunit
LGGAAAYYYRAPLIMLWRGDSVKFNSDTKSLDRIFTVTRGDLVIGTVLNGTVNSQKKHKMGLEAAFNTTLVWIAEENAKVKKGDILARFETEELETKIDDFKLNLENLEKELVVAREERNILESSNKSDIRATADKVKDVEKEMRKYHKFDKRKARDEQVASVTKAKKSFEESKDKYFKYKKEMKTASYSDEDDKKKSEEELETLKSEYTKLENEYKNALLDRKVYKRYTHPNKVTELYNKLDQSKLDLAKVKISATSGMLQKDKKINNLLAQKKKTEDQLEKHEKFMPMMKLIAPVDGVVIYGDPDRRWGKLEVKVGMDLRRKQVLMTIPDMSNMIVDFDLPEQYRSKVNEKNKVIITPDSLPGLKVNGAISNIASLPVNQIRWDSNSPKIYNSVITLEKQNPALVSGMSVKIEVITRTLKDVLFIPVEAVFEEKGKYFVYLNNGAKPEQCFIEIGQSNDNYVEVLKGLKEGDKIYLYQPFQSEKTD